MPVFLSFPTLTTDRLVLRQIGLDDASDIFAFRSDPEVVKYDVGEPLRDVAAVHDLIEEINEWYASRLAITWGITLRGENRVRGLFAFYFWDKHYYVAGLGYDLARVYWRQGIATEAIRALMHYGFDEMELHRINVDTRVDNVASVHLMARLGFTHEGTRRECLLSEDGTFQNWAIFGMLQQDYAE